MIQYLMFLDNLHDSTRDGYRIPRSRATGRTRSKGSIDEHGLCSREQSHAAVEICNGQ